MATKKQQVAAKSMKWQEVTGSGNMWQQKAAGGSMAKLIGVMGFKLVLMNII